MSSCGRVLPKGGAHAERMGTRGCPVSTHRVGGAGKAEPAGGSRGARAVGATGETTREALSRERRAVGESRLPLAHRLLAHVQLLGQLLLAHLQVLAQGAHLLGVPERPSVSFSHGWQDTRNRVACQVGRCETPLAAAPASYAAFLARHPSDTSTMPATARNTAIVGRPGAPFDPLGSPVDGMAAGPSTTVKATCAVASL